MCAPASVSRQAFLSGARQGSLVNTLREVEPTSHMGVPRVWEKFMEQIQAVAAQSGFIRRKLLLWAMSVTLEQNLTCPGRYGGQGTGGRGAAGLGHKASMHLRICWAGLALGTPVQRPHQVLGWRPLPDSTGDGHPTSGF